MDVELEKKIGEAIESIRNMSTDRTDFQRMDPVAKMMLVALIAEEQKIHDHIDSLKERLVERFCSDFIPRRKVEATPAVCLIKPEVKRTSDSSMVSVGSGSVFCYKAESIKQPLNYIPVFETSLLPHQGLYLLTPRQMKTEGKVIPVNMDRQEQVWLGIKTTTEVDNIKGLSLFIKGTGGVGPEHIYAVNDGSEIEFSTMLDMENLEMAEPFDAQQSSREMFSFVETWKECMLNLENASLVYITESAVNRDSFKPKSYPREFQQWLESDVLSSFDEGTVWLRLDFPDGFVVPDSCEIVLNVLPVTNVDVNSLMLTQTQPMAKLQRIEDSFFLCILETTTASNRQGFGMLSDEVIVRDFDASCYNNGDLYREVRNLYNHFIDDYYAFVEYNGIKDGEVLKQLRETINKLGKSVGQQNQTFCFDSGTYVMKNMNQYPPTSSTRVSYITTMGRIGNLPRTGDNMDNRKIPAVGQKVQVVVGGMGGADKATADERYEQLRYYSLTNDRLYTRMDVDAFMRKEIIGEFGKEEFRRISIKTNIGGTGGSTRLQRGLYVDIEFKDKKNYNRAVSMMFDKILQQKIINKSCIAMPIKVQLRNLEE